MTSIPDFAELYQDYALGRQLSGPRMPLHVPVSAKLGVKDIMAFMRDHYEGTALNMTSDVGAGPWDAKFRDRPLTWSYNNQHFVNERSIGTQQTAWHFVANMRHWLPDHIGGVFWFGVDDATFSGTDSQVLCILTLYSKYNRALTFQNFCQRTFPSTLSQRFPSLCLQALAPKSTLYTDLYIVNKKGPQLFRISFISASRHWLHCPSGLEFSILAA